MLVPLFCSQRHPIGSSENPVVHCLYSLKKLGISRLVPLIWLEPNMSDLQVPGDQRQQRNQTTIGRIDIDIEKAKIEDAERLALVADALRAGNGLGSRVRLRAFGESMLPTLWPGDIVEIASCSLDEVRPGEIVLALRDGRLFLHRLVKSKPNGFVLRGDSVPNADPLYPREALLGRLVSATTGTGAEGDKRPSFVASAWSRALGMLFCHCGMVRRLAVKFNRRPSASGHEFRTVETL
jgi:hypothetical protein